MTECICHNRGECAWCYAAKGCKKPKTETDPTWDPASPGVKHVLSTVSTPQSGASTMASTVVSTPRRNAEAAVDTPQSGRAREVAPPTPQGDRPEVGRDPEHAWAGTPARTQTTTATPSDEHKKSGSRASHPINFTG